jgi:hypothetical protein
MWFLMWLAFASPVTTLKKIDHAASVVRQHPEAAVEEAQYAARLATDVGDPDLALATAKMAESARRQNSPMDTRAKAIEVTDRVRAVLDRPPLSETPPLPAPPEPEE